MNKDKFTCKFDDADVKNLEKKFSEIEKHLLDNSAPNLHVIKYKNKNTESYPENNEDFIAAIGNEPAVYCIWLKRKPHGKFDLVYVGHAKKPGSRLRNHLSKKSEGTGAKLDKVKHAIENDGTIGVTFVKIKPPYMRTAIEEWLIGKIGKSNLPWNKRGEN